MDQVLQELTPKVDIDDFDRKLKEILHELQRKRTLLDESVKEVNESILKQQDLQRQLETESNKNQHEDYQNVILRNAVETLEEERQKINKNIIKLKVQLELSVAERDSLRNQVRSQCLQINNYKRQIEDLHNKRKCHENLQKDITEQLCKIKGALTEVNTFITSLRRKQEELKKSFKSVNDLNPMILSGKHFEEQKNILQKERDEMEKKYISKSAELTKLQEFLNDYTIMFKSVQNNDVLDFWKERCNHLEDQLHLEREGNEKLTNALKLSQEHEQFLRKKIKNEGKIAQLEENVRKGEIINKVDTQTQTNEIIEIVDLIKIESEEM